MKIKDIIGQEVDVTIPNKEYKVKGILHDVDSGGILVEITSLMYSGKVDGSNWAFRVGDIVYLKDKGFHLSKTKQVERDIKINQVI